MKAMEPVLEELKTGFYKTADRSNQNTMSNDYCVLVEIPQGPGTMCATIQSDITN